MLRSCATRQQKRWYKCELSGCVRAECGVQSEGQGERCATNGKMRGELAKLSRLYKRPRPSLVGKLQPDPPRLEIDVKVLARSAFVRASVAWWLASRIQWQSGKQTTASHYCHYAWLRQTSKSYQYLCSRSLRCTSESTSYFATLHARFRTPRNSLPGCYGIDSCQRAHHGNPQHLRQWTFDLQQLPKDCQCATALRCGGQLAYIRSMGSLQRPGAAGQRLPAGFDQGECAEGPDHRRRRAHRPDRGVFRRPDHVCFR